MGKKVLLILNSDFGGRQIGKRALPIANKFNDKEELTIFCRDYERQYEDKFNFVKVVPLGKLVMQGFTFVQVYITKRLPLNRIKATIFSYFMLRKLKRIDLNEVSIIHSWDFLPQIYKYVKANYPKIKIYQDLPIALPEILQGLKDTNILFKGEKLISPSYIKKSFKYIDYYIVPSNFVKDSLLLHKINSQKIKLVPFGADLKEFRVKKKSYKIFRVATLGNINHRKGISYLIEAWKELNLENAQLNLYGRVYPEINYLLKDIKKYNIKVHGFINAKDELYKNHVFAFPSLLEGSAKVIYEALACGIPVITTYNAGSVIEDGKEGFIVPVQDTQALKDKILFFYNNREKLAIFGKKARAKALKYSWDVYADSIYKLYNRKTIK